MSIATEITRLQGIKSDIRTALVTQGIAQASSHNMADFSADILAIQGSGGEGVYITVTCDSAYIGYDIILSANESELYRKQCSSSLEVSFFVSADDITLPATFTISNSLNSKTISVSANMYGWYNTELLNKFYILKNGVLQNGYTLKYFKETNSSIIYTAGTGIIAKSTLNSSCHYTFGFEQAVDVTNFSKIIFVANGNKKHKVGLRSKQISNYNSVPDIYVTQSSGTYEVDITNMTGNNYVAVHDNAGSEVGSATFTDIYLE